MCIAPWERIDFHSLDLVLSRAANRGRFRHDAVIVEIPLQLAINRPKQLMQIDFQRMEKSVTTNGAGFSVPL